MISKIAQNKIKKELSKGEHGYVETILIYLKENKIFNAKGEEFSDGMIRIMLNQKVSHARLEKAIFNCFENHVNLRKKEEQRRKSLLKTA